MSRGAMVAAARRSAMVAMQPPRPSRATAGPPVGLSLGIAFAGSAGAASPFPVAGPAVGLSLGVALAGTAGEAVVSGPVWVGTGWVLSEGVIRLVGPEYDISAPYEIVARIGRDGTAGYQAVVAFRNALGNTIEVYQSATALEHRIIVAVARTASMADLVGEGTVFAPGAGTVNTLVGIALNAGAVTDAPGSQGQLGSAEFRINASSGETPVAAQAGQRIREIAIYDRVLTADERTALHNGGVPIDWRAVEVDAAPITIQPVIYYDFSNREDDGAGGYRVLDLITTDHTTDAAVAAGTGDLTDFGTDP